MKHYTPIVLMDLEYYLIDRLKSPGDINGEDDTNVSWYTKGLKGTWEMPKFLGAIDYDHDKLLMLHNLAIHKRIKSPRDTLKKLKIGKGLSKEDTDLCLGTIRGLFGDIDKVPLSLNKYKGLTKHVLMWRLDRGI